MCISRRGVQITEVFIHDESPFLLQLAFCFTYFQLILFPTVYVFSADVMPAVYPNGP
jgi:hypothetical protein